MKAINNVKLGKTLSIIGIVLIYLWSFLYLDISIIGWDAFTNEEIIEERRKIISRTSINIINNLTIFIKLFMENHSNPTQNRTTIWFSYYQYCILLLDSWHRQYL